MRSTKNIMIEWYKMNETKIEIKLKYEYKQRWIKQLNEK